MTEAGLRRETQQRHRCAGNLDDRRTEQVIGRTGHDKVVLRQGSGRGSNRGSRGHDGRLIRHRQTRGVLHGDTLEHLHVAGVGHDDIILQRDVGEGKVARRGGVGREEHIRVLPRDEDEGKLTREGDGKKLLHPAKTAHQTQRDATLLTCDVVEDNTGSTGRAGRDGRLVARRISPRRDGPSHRAGRHRRHQVIVQQLKALERTRRLVVGARPAHRHLHIGKLRGVLDVLQQLPVEECLNRHEGVTIVGSDRGARGEDGVVDDHGPHIN